MAKLPKVTPAQIAEAESLLADLLNKPFVPSLKAGAKKAKVEVKSLFERLLGGEKITDKTTTVSGGVGSPANTSGKNVASKVSKSGDYVPASRVKAPSARVATELSKQSSKIRGRATAHSLTEREKEKGILTLENAAKSVRAVLEGGSRQILDIAALIPIVGTGIGLAELTTGMPDSDAIITIMRELVMSQSNKRKREKLAARTAGARGPTSRATYVLRRKDGTGYDRKRKKMLTFATREPEPAPPAQIVPASPPGGPAQDVQKKVIDEMQKAALAKLKT